MAEIHLTQNQVALVDNRLYRRICAAGPWRFAYRKGKCHYAVSHSVGYMHRYVIKLLCGICPRRVDHKNGNGLDNRSRNLRVATHRQNLRNRPLNKNNTCGYKGVHKLPSGKYRARICIPKGKHLGCFNTSKQAALAYDKAASHYFGRFAWLNFPKGT